MAAAIFYRDVAVRDLASFLRGFDTPFASPSIVPKSSLLAITRSLCVVPSPRLLLHDKTITKDLQILAAERIMLDEADDLLSVIRRSSNPFPSLHHLQFGLPDYFGHRVDPIDDSLGSKLLRTCRPKVLCNYDTYREDDCQLHTRPDAFIHSTLPETIITHVDVGLSFGIAWGTENRVFLMEWDSCNWYTQEGGNWARQYANYLFDNLCGAPEWALKGTQVFEDLPRKTRIKVYGMTDDCYDTAYVNDDGDQTGRASKQEIKAIEDSLRRRLQTRHGGSDEAWKACLELACKEDRPHCPVCGLNMYFRRTPKV